MYKSKELYESAKKEANLNRYGDDSSSCVCCGKKTNKEIFVHMDTNWMVVENTLDEDDLEKFGVESQGMFPVGPSCAKKVGKKFLHYDYK